MRAASTWVLLLALCECSGKDLTAGSQSSTSSADAGRVALDACYAECVARAQATKCQPGGTSESQCRSGCQAVVPGLTGTCREKATALYECGAHASWSCVHYGVPETLDGGCAVENKAYAPCFQTK